MTGTLAVATRIDCTRFEVAYVGADGVECRGSLAGCWNAPFEDALPVRAFPAFKGQGNFPGWWWSSTMDCHVGYESWLERDHAMRLDADGDVVGFASQPFCLSWLGEAGGRRHTPDFFARRADGTGVVVDVRADDRIGPADADAFAMTAAACAQVGWVFERVGELPPVFAGNLRWLARYRHPRCGRREDVAERLRNVFVRPAPLLAGAAEAGETLGVLPVLYHLMWRRVLVADLEAAPLGPGTVVRAVDGRTR